MEPIRNGLGEAGSFDDRDWPRYIRTTDIGGPRRLREDTFASLPPATAASAKLRRGDIVMTAAGATIGKSLLYDSDESACFAGYLVRFRPRPGVNERFISYWTESTAYWSQIEAGKVVSTIENFSASKYQNLVLHVPSDPEQRAIADFLDTETARIDALITKKRRMIELLAERHADAAETAIRNIVSTTGDRALKRAVSDITVGIVVTPSEWYATAGVPALRGLNVRPGVIDTSEMVFLTEEGHRLHGKSALREGDVVVMRTGQAGAAAVIPSQLDGANCIDLLLIRPGEMVPEFLAFVLNSDWTQKHIASHSVGSIQSHFNVGALRELPVPKASATLQRQLAESLQRQAAKVSTFLAKLTRQLTLLQERRQALITAAVTGELEVRGAA